MRRIQKLEQDFPLLGERVRVRASSILFSLQPRFTGSIRKFLFQGNLSPRESAGARPEGLRGKETLLVFGIIALLTWCPALHATTPVQQQLDTLITVAQGKRIGLITNPAGCDESGFQDVDYLTNASGFTISAFFAPEHGLRGDLPAGQTFADYIDPVTGIPVYAV